MRSTACFALVLSLLAASCGGNVVVDPGGSSSMTSLETCVAACTAVSMACSGATTQPCDTTCQKVDPLFEAACPDAYVAYMTCVAANPTSVCASPGTMTPCTAEVTTFQACSSQVCAQPSNCE